MNFPNPSRCFDESNSWVQFWGYDGAIEVNFFVEVGALRKLCPEMGDADAGFLCAFDSAREKIHQAAEKMYSRGRSRHFSYVLAANDV